jgi:iron complex outermembrane receptor protein
MAGLIGELLKTCCVGEFRACGARRTLGTCPVFAKPVGTNFARSRRFREVPIAKNPYSAGISKRKSLKLPVAWTLLFSIWSTAATQTVAADDSLLISATRIPTAELVTPGAVDLLRVRRIGDTLPLIDVAEVLNRVAGVNVQNRQNYAQDTQISIRGFGARASFGIRGIKIFVDDIPATIPDGQGQGSVIPLFAAASMEVLRGPSAVGYGNAAGGVIAVTTQPAVPRGGVESRAIVGQDGMQITLLQLWSPRLEGRDGERDASAFIATQRLVSEGYRDHSRVKRDHTYAKLELPVWGSASLMLTGHRIDQPNTQDPLGITATQFAHGDRRQVAAAAVQFNTRKSISHQQVGSVLSLMLGGVEAKAIAYVGMRDVSQYLSIPVAAQLASTSAGGVVDFHRRFDGLGLRLAKVAGRVTWAIGVDADGARDDRKGYENFVGQGSAVMLGVRGNLRRDEINTQRSRDVFGQLNWAVTTSASLHAGLRRSDIKLSVRDGYIRIGNGDDSGDIRFAATSPSISVVKQFSTDTSLYVTGARGFETPTSAELAYKPDQSNGLNTTLSPSVARQWEVGVKHIGAVTLNAAVFTIRTQDEIVQASSIGGRATFQNAAATSRRGLELSAKWNRANQWSALAALTRLNATVSEAYLAGGGATARLIPAGQWLPAVPRANIFTELTWHPSGRGAPGWLVSAEAVARSRIATDDANSTFAAGYAALNAAVRYRTAVMRPFGDVLPIKLEMFVRAENLADAKYVGSVIVNEANQRFFEPAPARRFLLGVTGTILF